MALLLGLDTDLNLPLPTKLVRQLSVPSQQRALRSAPPLTRQHSAPASISLARKASRFNASSALPFLRAAPSIALFFDARTLASLPVVSRAWNLRVWSAGAHIWPMVYLRDLRVFGVCVVDLYGSSGGDRIYDARWSRSRYIQFQSIVRHVASHQHWVTLGALQRQEQEEAATERSRRLWKTLNISFIRTQLASLRVLTKRKRQECADRNLASLNNEVLSDADALVRRCRQAARLQRCLTKATVHVGSRESSAGSTLERRRRQFVAIVDRVLARGRIGAWKLTLHPSASAFDAKLAERGAAASGASALARCVSRFDLGSAAALGEGVSAATWEKRAAAADAMRDTLLKVIRPRAELEHDLCCAHTSCAIGKLAECDSVLSRVVAKVYRHRARELHPDKQPAHMSSSMASERETQRVALDKARSVLVDDGARRAYNAAQSHSAYVRSVMAREVAAQKEKERTGKQRRGNRRALLLTGGLPDTMAAPFVQVLPSNAKNVEVVVRWKGLVRVSDLARNANSVVLQRRSGAEDAAAVEPMWTPCTLSSAAASRWMWRTTIVLQDDATELLSFRIAAANHLGRSSWSVVTTVRLQSRALQRAEAVAQTRAAKEVAADAKRRAAAAVSRKYRKMTSRLNALSAAMIDQEGDAEEEDGDDDCDDDEYDDREESIAGAHGTSSDEEAGADADVAAKAFRRLKHAIKAADALRSRCLHRDVAVNAVLWEMLVAAHGRASLVVLQLASAAAVDAARDASNAAAVHARCAASAAAKSRRAAAKVRVRMRKQMALPRAAGAAPPPPPPPKVELTKEDQVAAWKEKRAAAKAARAAEKQRRAEQREAKRHGRAGNKARGSRQT